MKNLQKIFDAIALADMGSFGMSSLREKHTGVPCTIWVSVKMASYWPRVKVQLDNNTVFIKIYKNPKVIGSINLKGKEAIEKAIEFVKLNKSVLIDYWENKIDTVDMAQQIKPLSGN